MSPSIPQQQQQQQHQQQQPRTKKRTTRIAACNNHPNDDDDTDMKIPVLLPPPPPPTTTTTTTTKTTTRTGSSVNSNTTRNDDDDDDDDDDNDNSNSKNRYQHILRPRKKVNRSSSPIPTALLPPSTVVVANNIPPPQITSVPKKYTTTKKKSNDVVVTAPHSTYTLRKVVVVPTSQGRSSRRCRHHSTSVKAETCMTRQSDPTVSLVRPPQTSTTSSVIQTRSQKKRLVSPTHPIAVVPVVVTPRHTTTATTTANQKEVSSPKHRTMKKCMNDDDDNNNNISKQYYYDPTIAIDRSRNELPDGVINLFPVVFPKHPTTTTTSTTTTTKTYHHHPKQTCHKSYNYTSSNDYISSYGLEYLFLLQQQQQQNDESLRSTTCAAAVDDENDDDDNNNNYDKIRFDTNTTTEQRPDIQECTLESTTSSTEPKKDDSSHKKTNNSNCSENHIGSTTDVNHPNVHPNQTQSGTPKQHHRPFRHLSPLTTDDDNDNNNNNNNNTTGNLNTSGDPWQMMNPTLTTPVINVQVESVFPRSIDDSEVSKSTVKRRSLPPPTTITSSGTLLNQPLLTTRMRRTLVLWLSEVCQEFHLSDATYHLAITLLDVTLLQNGLSIHREQFQAVGCVCLWIASKLEDVKAPSRHELCYISDYSVSNGQLLRLEQHICSLLQFRLQRVTPYHLLPIFLRASAADETTNALSRTLEDCDPIDVPFVSMVKYLLELSRASYRLTHERPDLLTASCVYLARATLGIVGRGKNKQTHTKDLYWTKTLQYYTTYDTTDMVDTIIKMYELQIAAESAASKGVGGCPPYKKYGMRDHHCVSLKAPPRLEDLGLPNLDVDYDNFVEPRFNL